MSATPRSFAMATFANLSHWALHFHVHSPEVDHSAPCSHPRCVSSKYKFSNDEDVDDEYTEKGRQLVAREREAVAKGFALGQVLTAAFFDLDFPDIVGGPRSEWRGVK